MNITLIKVNSTRWKITNKDNGKYVDMEKVFFGNHHQYEIYTGIGWNKKVLYKGSVNFYQAKRRALKFLK